MNRVIHKYPLELTERQTIKHLPCFTPAHVGLDPSGALCLWAEVDLIDSAPICSIDVEIFGTGHTIPPPPHHWARQFVGSVVQGSFVWHVYLLNYEPF